MDAQTLGEAMGWSLSLARYEQLLPAYEQAMRDADINNVNRAAQWAAQLGHESVGLSALEEFASGAAYEGRADLGNTQPGDGVRYKGRGAIMVTGRANYRNLSRWAHTQGMVPTPTYFEDNPKALQSTEHAFVGAVWYWTQARPQLNGLADAGDLVGATRAINGGLNGIADRRVRYERCLRLGAALVPKGDTEVIEKRLDYPRTNVHQDTYYWCGPASAQTVILSATGKLIPEGDLAREMGTTINGTNGIQNILPSLNRHIPGKGYVEVHMPNDPPLKEQTERLWEHLTRSVDAGLGIVANIWAPPSNYPRPSYKSTSRLQYSGGFVKHYVAFMGYAVDSNGGRHVWWADSGFAPYGCWVSLEQTATLVPPRSYAWPSTAPKAELPKPENSGGGITVENDGLIQSLVNPSKRFTRDHLLAINDRTLWETHVMVKELLRRAGINPDEFVAKAIEEDNRK